MQLNLITLSVVAANVLGAAMAAPQAIKLIRTRVVAGVSLTWAAISATINAWWAVYGISIGDPGIVPVSIVSVMAYLAIAVYVLRITGRPTWSAIAATSAATAVVATVPAIVLVVDGWASAGITLGALYGVQLSPAVIGVYRVIDVSGVSLATWTIAFTEAALWGVYGWSTLDAGLLALAATGVFMSTLVLVRLFLRRPRRARADAHLGRPAFAAV